MILVTGSRDWTDENAVEKHLLKLIVDLGYRFPDVAVVAGGADGVDTMTKDICLRHCIAFFECSAPWEFFRRVGNARAAGPMRNGWMVRWMRPQAVLALHPYLPGSKGTKNCVEQARKAGVPTIRILPK